MEGVGLYWRFEKWLRRQESDLHSTVGVTGAICAVRKQLFRPIPQGTLLDDVYWPLCVTMQGFRVVLDDRARAYDRLPELMISEFRRKVRTLSGNFQLIARLPSSLIPWRNPVWFYLIAHKLARLAVPWAMMVLLVSAAIGGSVLHWTVFSAVTLALSLGIIGLVPGAASRSRVLSASAAVLMLNVAAWWAFWVWMSGRASRSWNKTPYRHVPTPQSRANSNPPNDSPLRPVGAE
jgi:hypothetical protein